MHLLNSACTHTHSSTIIPRSHVHSECKGKGQRERERERGGGGGGGVTGERALQVDMQEPVQYGIPYYDKPRWAVFLTKDEREQSPCLVY